MDNLLKRTLSGIVFIIVLVFGLIWDRLIFGCLFLLIMYFCLNEFYEISIPGRFTIGKKLGILAGAAMLIAMSCHYFWGMDLRLFLIPLVLVLCLPVAQVAFNDKENFSDIGIIYVGLFFIALPISLSPIVVMDGDIFDGWMLLSVFIVVWASDVGAFCIGSLLGQRPGSLRLAPEISPNKSWWGFGGGVAFSIAASILLHYLTWFPFPLLNCIILGVIVGVGGVFGDLFESAWKRRYGVKNSGKLIPGHGGMLDRFDSSLVAIPLSFVYLAIFNLI